MQIVNTLKCNFACRHCLFMCSPRRTEMLDNCTLQRFMDNFGDYAEFINYCVGETFLNPDWEWQLRYLSNFTDCLRIVTNGSKFFMRNGNKTKLLKEFLEVLWDISRDCRVTVLISNDEFHREFYDKKDLFPLDQVIKFFRFEVWNIYNVDIELDRRDISNNIIAMGRALKTGCSTSEGVPMCDYFEPTLMPNGDVKGCCNGRMDVGSFSNSYEYCEEIFKRLEKPKTCLSCKHR